MKLRQIRAERAKQLHPMDWTFEAIEGTDFYAETYYSYHQKTILVDIDASENIERIMELGAAYFENEHDARNEEKAERANSDWFGGDGPAGCYGPDDDAHLRLD